MTTRHVFCGVLLALSMIVLALGGPGDARGEEPTITLESLLGEMVDRDAAARWPEPAFSCKQASSFDRAQTDPADPAGWFANKDYEQFIRVEENEGRREWVIMEHQGPGCIARFWVPLLGAKENQTIRFYLDGSPKPAIAAKFNELLSGRAFVKPPSAFVASDEQTTQGVAGALYLPIPFAQGCKITLDELPFYYIVNYRAYEPGTKVKTFTMDDYQAADAVLRRTAQQLSEPGGPPGQPQRSDGRIEPGAELAMDLPAGPAAVRLLQVQIDPQDAPQVLRSAVVEAAFDGQPAVWCPLGDLFGCGARLSAVQDWYRTVEEDGSLTARWVMPYRQSARIAVRNLGKQAISLKLAAAADPWTWDERSMHFHAAWRHQDPLKTRPMSDWNYVEIAGRGVYVGDTLTVFNPSPAWYGEGDERVYIDGEKLPSHRGTGTEDYYGYAWGMARHFSSPFLSMPTRDGKSRQDWRGYTTTSRMRLLDAIPLRTSLKVDMEVWHWADTSVAYSVGTFWYARPGATCNRDPAPAEAARDLVAWPPPPPAAFKGAIECEGMKVLASTPGVPVEVQHLAGMLPGEWSGGAQLFIRATKPGDFVELLAAEKIDGPRRLTLHATKSYDYGILRFSINGKPVEPTFDGFQGTPVPFGPIDLGVHEPKEGRFVLRVEVVGSNPASRGPKHYFGLDCVLLGPAK